MNETKEIFRTTARAIINGLEREGYEKIGDTRTIEEEYGDYLFIEEDGYRLACVSIGKDTTAVLTECDDIIYFVELLDNEEAKTIILDYAYENMAHPTRYWECPAGCGEYLKEIDLYGQIYQFESSSWRKVDVGFDEETIDCGCI